MCHGVGGLRSICTFRSEVWSEGEFDGGGRGGEDKGVTLLDDLSTRAHLVQTPQYRSAVSGTKAH